ncbi:MAG: RNA-binding S4 domain-containing protein [Bacillota bacterium]|nr:RNA-binding S4 domain-containing protein [Bacillota bacterium]
MEQPVFISSESINLDALLKWSGAALTGGAAKHVIRSGQVEVNGRPETRRSRKILPGDRVTLGSIVLVVETKR